MTDSTDNARPLGPWQAFPSDGTDNARGPERIWWNAAPMPHSHTSTVQFAGGVEYIRADLAPDPLVDPRVVALVDAVDETVRLLWEEMSKQGNVGTHGGYIYMKLRPALAALSTGGNADG